jgi:septal ring factor EnvC (AmiA/AmiB activator)
VPELILLSFLRVLAERESESKEVRLNISELEANANDLHEKFEQALAHLEQESDETDNEIATNKEGIQKLGDQVYRLEEENDKLRDEFERMMEDEGAERDT